MSLRLLSCYLVITVFRYQACKFLLEWEIQSNFGAVSPLIIFQDETCLKAYDELKLGKKHKFIIYSIASDSKSITTVKQATLEEGKEWETFVEQLPEKECRWGVYDLEYDQGEGKRNKLCFVMW